MANGNGENKFVKFVKAHASKNKMTYSEALKDPKMRMAYDKTKKVSPGKKGAASKSMPGKIDDSTKKGGVRRTARRAFEKKK